MYPILFPANATAFNTQGVGVLSSALECIVTEERNGEYELFMRYPEKGPHFSEIQNSAIIVAIPSDGGTRQAFRIYKVSRPINGVISINAQHISYQLSYIPTKPFEAANLSDALAGLKSNALEACPFTFWTNITSSANYSQKVPESIRAQLGGQQGSFLDVYGGEYEWDNYTVRLWKNRGSDSGATLRYGKNITDIEQEESIENTYTGICPYWKNDEEMVTLPEGVIHASTAANFPYQRTIPIDFSSEYEEPPTVEQLRNTAEAYIRRNKIGIPRVSISVSFIALWQTEEYKSIAPLERVKLCDTVQVYFERLGISTTAMVTKTEYDVIRERYTAIDVGESRHTLTSVVADTADEIETTAKELTAETQKAINTSTKLITGAKGGFIRLMLDPDTKQPYELVIMEKDDINAENNPMWIWNKEGWGYFPNGHTGDPVLAATMDGVINADFIQAGTMKANRIKGGELTLGGADNGDGVLEVKDSEGSVRGRWSNDGIQSLWIDQNSGQATDYLSINGEAGGVIYIQEVDPTSTVYNPKPKGSNAWLSYGELTFETSDRCQGHLTATQVRVEETDASNDHYVSVYAARGATIEGDVSIEAEGNLDVEGSKNRAVQTDFGKILLSAYETASPYFGDIGSGVCGDDGQCFVELDARLADVCNTDEYHVFISAYDGAELSVSRFPGYFVVTGSPGDEFAWEVKAKQSGYEANRFDVKIPREWQEHEKDEGTKAAEYVVMLQQEMMESGGDNEGSNIGDGISDSCGVEDVNPVL